MTIEEHIQALMRVPNYQRVYIVGCYENRITLHSQQHRALNLAWCLQRTGTVSARTRVAVIGGGVAGLTVAAGLVTSHCRVSLYEQAAQLLHIQRGNHTRYIHPNIYDWPDEGSHIKLTNLPFLNWRAGTSSEVVRQIDSQWEPFQRELSVYTNREITSLLEKNHAVELRVKFTDACRQEEVRLYDVVILTVGFGVEKRLSQWPSNSYWRDDALHQSFLDDVFRRRRILVVGCGDGGLVDAIRLTLRDFDHGFITDSIALDPAITQTGYEMRGIDEAVRDLPASDQSDALLERYHDLRLPGKLEKIIRENSRTDTDVTVAARHSTLFRLNTSLINRLLVYGLYRIGKISFMQIDQLDPESINSKFNLVVPRIGPEASVSKLVQDDDELKTSRAKLLDEVKPGTTKYWSHNSFQKIHRAKHQAKVLILSNSDNLHASIIIETFRSTLRGLISGTPLTLSFEERLLDPINKKFRTNINETNELISRLQIDTVIIISSDIAKFADSIAEKVANIVLIGESVTMVPIREKIERKGSKSSVYAVIQEMDLDDIVNTIELAFPNKTIGFVLNEKYDVDLAYFDALKHIVDAHAKSGRGNIKMVGLKVNDPILDDGQRKVADILAGRYFLHSHMADFAAYDLPLISGYRGDLDRGAILTFDTDDLETGKVLAEEVMAPLLLSGSAAHKVVRIVRPMLSLHLGNARRHGVVFNDRLLSMADELVE